MFAGCDDPQYAIRRQRMAKLVSYALETSGVNATAVRGSWLHGDFHLSLDRNESFSDLDLVIADASCDESARLASCIQERLRFTMAIRVAVHPLESMRGMTIEDSRLLLIGEYLISVLGKVPRGLMSVDYVRAKISLLLLRESPTERYLDVARRFGSDALTRASRVKHGTERLFSSADMAVCLAGMRDSQVTRFVDLFGDGTPDSERVAAWCREVARAPSIGDWLKVYVLDRVEECLRR